MSNGESVVDLLAAIDRQVKQVHTQSLDISFNELADMKQAGELDINPDYQRLFQWSEGAQSRFIESLLLEMPVPPIYVVEELDGRFMLIDGLQRISSYLHLRGMLEASHLDPPISLGDKLVLSDCDIVTELNGRAFDDLGTALQIRLKRSFVRVEVVRKGSDARFKYHMFKRLNTGGEQLSDQQVRNCTIRLLDPKFNEFIVELSRTEHFERTVATLTPEQRYRALDQELVLRFFTFRHWAERFKHDIGDLLTQFMEAVSDPDPARVQPFDYETERMVFRKTFELFALTLGELSFGYYSPRFGKVVAGFSVLHFEAFTLGVQNHLDDIDLGNTEQLARLKQAFEGIKVDPEFVEITRGGGKNSPGPFRARIDFVAAEVVKHI